MGVEPRRAVGRHKKLSPPIFSHDFVILNHGDIMSCVLMVFIVGLMFPLTSSIAAVFVAPQYNETVNTLSDQGTVSVTSYSNGFADVWTIMFYTVAWIVGHAVIQEYVLDKFQRKAHLSKVKTFKFTESGHHVLFCLYSTIHAGYIIYEFVNSIGDFKRIWSSYPDDHKWMSLNTKLFAILQIAYWVHQFPEFYFQRFKSDEMRTRTFVSVTYTAFIGAAYTMNFMRLAAVLLFLEYFSQMIFHIARLFHFMDRKEFAKIGFRTWNIIFVVVRMLSTMLAVTTFWYGLRQSEAANIDVSNGNFNTAYIRLNCLLALLSLQLFQMASFVTFHIGKYKETSSRKKSERKSVSAEQQIKTKKSKEDSDSDSGDASTQKLQKKKN